MLTINDLRDRHGVKNVKWTQNMISAGHLRPDKIGTQWLFSPDEALVASAIFQSREALGTLPSETYGRMAVAMRELFAKDERREGVLYLGVDEASWKPLAPAMTVRMGQ